MMRGAIGAAGYTESKLAQPPGGCKDLNFITFTSSLRAPEILCEHAAYAICGLSYRAFNAS
jgi:hypothetical protein